MVSWVTKVLPMVLRELGRVGSQGVIGWGQVVCTRLMQIQFWYSVELGVTLQNA